MAESAIEPPAIGTAETTLAHVLARRLADSADKPWVADEDRAFTYREIDRLSNRLANGLARLGVARGGHTGAGQSQEVGGHHRPRHLHGLRDRLQ